MLKIYVFCISLLACLIASIHCQAQDTIRYPIAKMKGIRIGIDVSKPVMPLVFNKQRMGIELSADVHIKNNLFLAADGGWQQATLSRDSAYNYIVNGGYGKIGVDYNILKQRRPNMNDMIYWGARYAIGSFSQQADNIYIPAQYWQEKTDGIIPKTNLSAQWLELLFGVRAEVLKNLYLGMSFRLKLLTIKPQDSYSTPYLIPGFGTPTRVGYGMNYYLMYNFHF